MIGASRKLNPCAANCRAACARVLRNIAGSVRRAPGRGGRRHAAAAPEIPGVRLDRQRADDRPAGALAQGPQAGARPSAPAAPGRRAARRARRRARRRRPAGRARPSRPRPARAGRRPRRRRADGRDPSPASRLRSGWPRCTAARRSMPPRTAPAAPSSGMWRCSSAHARVSQRQGGSGSSPSPAIVSVVSGRRATAARARRAAPTAPLYSMIRPKNSSDGCRRQRLRVGLVDAVWDDDHRCTQ